MNAPGCSRARGGYALLAVLWVVVGLSALALVAATAARDAVSAAASRAELARAGWAAEGCLERARAAISTTLAAAQDEGPEVPSWQALDAALARSPLARGCDLRLEAAGSRLDVNAASAGQLRRLLGVLGVAAPRADSLADALADWRDTDQLPRARGAEAEWYASRHAHTPRNAAFADPRELRWVRGMAGVPALDTLLDTEPGRLVVDRAPLPVLASLPGLGSEAMGVLGATRRAGGRLPEWLVLAERLGPAARADLLRAIPDLTTTTTRVPDAWILTARAGSGTPAARVAIELRLVRAGARAAIVRRRSWIE